MEPLRSIEFERHYVIPGAITLDNGDVPHLAGKVFASPSPEATPLVFGDSKLACESQGPILCIQGSAVRRLPRSELKRALPFVRRACRNWRFSQDGSVYGSGALPCRPRAARGLHARQSDS